MLLDSLKVRFLLFLASISFMLIPGFFKAIIQDCSLRECFDRMAFQTFKSFLPLLDN